MLDMAKELSGTLDLRGAGRRRWSGAPPQVLPADVVATIYWDTDARGLSPDLAARPARRIWPASVRRMSFPLGEHLRRRGGGRRDVGGRRAGSGCGADEQRYDATLRRRRAGRPRRWCIRGQVRGAFSSAAARQRPLQRPHRCTSSRASARQLAVAIESGRALPRPAGRDAVLGAALARVGQELISSLATPAVYGACAASPPRCSTATSAPRFCGTPGRTPMLPPPATATRRSAGRCCASCA